MTEIDELVRRAVGTVTTIADKAARFSGKILLAVTVVCVGGFLLGVAALSGGIQTVWIVLGIVFGAIAIGGSFTALWRAGAVRRHGGELGREVRALVERERDPSRTVIESFVVDTDVGPDGTPSGSAIVLSRQMHGFSNAVGPAGLAESPRLAEAVRALTTFPLLILMAIAISGVFAFLGVIFLIALAL